MPKSIPIFLNRDNYEQQIELHGQYTLWKSNQVCACIDANGRPNPNCELCDGLGKTYYDNTVFHRMRERIITSGSVGTTKYSRIISVDKVYDDTGTLTVLCFHGNQIMFNKEVGKSQVLYVDYTFDSRLYSSGTIGTYKGNGIIEIPNFGFQTQRGGYVKYEIINATNMVNLTTPNDKLTFIDAYQNFVIVDTFDTIATVGDQIRMDLEYVSPILMQIVGISEKMRYNNSYMLPEAESSLTVPAHIEIAEGDIFTLVLTEQPFSLVKQFHGQIDSLDHYDVSRIIRVIDRFNHEYVSGVDYVQISRDKIKWLNSSMLTGSYSIKYSYRIMFRALNSMPSLRYGENQPFPKKIMLKQYSRIHSEPLKNL